jgi:hypothetical protein
MRFPLIRKLRTIYARYQLRVDLPLNHARQDIQFFACNISGILGRQPEIHPIYILIIHIKNNFAYLPKNIPPVGKRPAQIFS